jgi:hypothetical protein
MPDANETEDITAALARHACDAAYTAVGLGVLGLQRAQALRHDLVQRERVDEGVARLRTGVATGSQQLGEWLDGTLSFVSAQLAPLCAQLPEPARDLADRARSGLEAVRAQLRQLAAPGA